MTVSARNPIAYFSLEFGIDSNIPTYAGGLGILAADTLLQAADEDFPIVAIGMMYKGRKFIQKINELGEQVEEPTPFRLDGSSSFRRVEVNAIPVKFEVTVGEEHIWVEAYKQRLGDHVTLFLLTTDVEGNSDYWRNLFDEIYWGSDEEQIKERIIFGIGGMRLLSELNIKPSLIHIQEGRPSFVALPVMSELQRKNPQASFEEVLQETKQNIVYTNHTLVASGIHSYDSGLVEKYLEPLAREFNLDLQKIIQLGKLPDNRFHTTQFALTVSRSANTVSTPHHKLAKKEYPQFEWINITNGVHMPRWQQREYLSASITDQALWETHLTKKHSLMREVTSRVGFGYDHNMFTVTWARRVSGYKQLPALFASIDELAKVLTNTAKPVMLLIAGKAHPGDLEGKDLIKKIIDYMRGPLAGHAIFVHNYDIALASQLVAGSDLWLNTPQMGREASGTSGMKAISNGVLQATIKDGWAAEVEWSELGWVLDDKRLSQSIYETIGKAQELYFDRNENGVPITWVQMMRKSIQTSQKYSTARMLAEYKKKLYKL